MLAIVVIRGVRHFFHIAPADVATEGWSVQADTTMVECRYMGQVPQKQLRAFVYPRGCSHSGAGAGARVFAERTVDVRPRRRMRVGRIVRPANLA